MENIVEMTTAAFDLVRKPYDPFNIKYGKYSSIYLAPTGNVKDMMEPFKGAKRVLAVGGAGAFGFEADINGAEVVDMFDCNALQKCFFELVKASIIVLSYEEFMTYFSLVVQKEVMTHKEMQDLISPVLFRKIEDFLPFEARFLYEELFSRYDSVDMLHSSLYRYAHAIYREYLCRFASMYDEEKYYQLQDKLRRRVCKVEYSIESLTDLPKKFKGPYDLVVLGNILQYYEKIPLLDTPYAVNMFIKKELSKLLSEDGVIQVNYGFGLATEIWKKKQGLPITKNAYNSTLQGNMQIDANMKKDLNTALFARGGYDYYLFEGVETYDTGARVDNMSLVYRPKANKK